MKVEVIEGEILVNDLWLNVDLDDLKVIGADLMSKYPDHVVSSDDSSIEIVLFKSDMTMNADEGAGAPTKVRILNHSGREWHCLVEVSRYTMEIVMWRESGTVTHLWQGRPS